jgi:pimeloyl-ACP methyl ester carboxylesterase
MGGKAAMTLALRYPERVRALVVVDIAPKSYQLSEHHHLLSTLAAVDLSTFENRTQLDAFLARDIPQMDTRQFILKNIYRSDEGVFAWRMNVQGLLAELNSVGDDSPFVDCPPVDLPALFIAGGASNYIRIADEEGIRALFPHAQIARISGAGHWVHSDAPDALSKQVFSFLFA